MNIFPALSYCIIGFNLMNYCFIVTGQKFGGLDTDSMGMGGVCYEFHFHISFSTIF